MVSACCTACVRVSVSVGPVKCFKSNTIIKGERERERGRKKGRETGREREREREGGREGVKDMQD